MTLSQWQATASRQDLLSRFDVPLTREGVAADVVIDELALIRDQATLTNADLTNRATHDGDHNKWPVAQLIERFEHKRQRLVSTIRSTNDSELERSAIHPRLGAPMRLIDLAYLVAEHDDHHLSKLREMTLKHGTNSRKL